MGAIVPELERILQEHRDTQKGMRSAGDFRWDIFDLEYVAEDILKGVIYGRTTRQRAGYMQSGIRHPE